MSFSGIESEVLYSIVSINIYIGKDMDKGHYASDVLDYNKGTWWNFGDDTITQYPGYTMNLYYEPLIDKKQKQNWKIVCMNGSDKIVSMVYILLN